MKLSEKVVRGPYLADLLEQPKAVQDTARALESLSVPRFDVDRVILTGMGSSLAAVHPLALRLIAHGVTAIVVDTSELLYGMSALLNGLSLVVAVSQSGRSAEIVRLVDRNPNTPIIAVTNTPDSPLAMGAKASVLTHAGAESTVSCKTYVATLVALARLGDALTKTSEGGDALTNAHELMSSYLETWESHINDLTPLTDRTHDVFLAGRGASLAAVHTASLIIKESARVHSEGMTSAALRHGPMEMAAASKALALVYDGDETVKPLNRRLVTDLKQAGTRAFAVGEDAAVPALRLPSSHVMARPLVEILPAQMLSLALAAQKGIEAGRFTHASKVTSTE